MTPQFARLVDPIFLAVLGLAQRLEAGETLDLQTQRANLRSVMDESAKKAAEADSRLRPEEFELAKRGLICWADEILTDADSRWENILLEVEYYGPPRKRAFNFYVFGEEQARNSSPDVVEVWYLAMALGFRGDIRDAFRNKLNRELPGGKTDPDEARRAWARELTLRIRESRLPDLAGEPLRCDVPSLTGRSFMQRAAGVLLILAAVGTALYLLPGHLAGQAPKAGKQPSGRTPAHSNRP